MAAVITAGDRKAPAGPNPTDAERAELIAHSQPIRVHPELMGQTLVSIKNSKYSVVEWHGAGPQLEFKGKTVTGTSEPFKSLVFGEDVVAVTTWSGLRAIKTGSQRILKGNHEFADRQLAFG